MNGVFLSSPDTCLHTLNIIKNIPTVNTIDKYKPVVQASAGIVLILFLIAGAVLCFRFTMRIMLIFCYSCSNSIIITFILNITIIIIIF